MKLRTTMKGLVVTAFAAAIVALPLTASAITPGSIAYEGEDTSGTTYPAFNIFNGVPRVGNEADFVRVKKDGESNDAYRDALDAVCKTGDRFDVWFYLHNGAKPSLNDNGNGAGVAKDVVAKVALPAAESDSFKITGNVTASNAQAVSDDATIDCGEKKFTLKYVEDSANAYLDLPNKVVQLPRAFVEGGTQIGTNELNGKVWGCWDQRVWMNLKVVVTEVPETPEQPETPEEPETPEQPKEEPKKPVEKPAELPETGAGSIASIFGLTTVAGAAAHYAVAARRRK